MGLGLGILLLVIGAIMAFAVNYQVSGIEVSTIGYILMAAGALSLLLGLVMNAQRTNTTHREVVDRHTDSDVRHRGDGV
ncbi:DUF6458 family protein [Ornithinimicrobium sp. Y1847]|uniref:DUF6458 family protein n=1 Tax=unclassified Ornithinimicrobium TaxID=2615080 RepID=UPI003B674663